MGIEFNYPELQDEPSQVDCGYWEERNRDIYLRHQAPSLRNEAWIDGKVDGQEVPEKQLLFHFSFGSF